MVSQDHDVEAKFLISMSLPDPVMELKGEIGQMIPCHLESVLRG